jgi:O-antigen ligase
MSGQSLINFQKKILYCAIFFIPLAGLGFFIPYLSFSLFLFIVYIITNLFLADITKIKDNKFAIFLLFLLYFLIVIISFINFEPNTTNGFSFIRQFILYLVIFYYLAKAFQKGLLEMKLMLIYYILGVAGLLLIALLGINSSVDNFGRASIMGVNANKISVFGSVAIMFCLNLLHFYRFPSTIKISISVLILGFFYLMIITGSRGGFIGLAIAVLVYYYFKNFGIRRYGNIFKGILLVSIIGMLVLSNDLLYQRFFGIEDISEDRTVIWTEALKIAQDDLVFGVGVFKYEVEISKVFGEFVAIHNEYLTIILYSGCVGLFVFLLFLFQTLKSALKATRVQKNPLFVAIFALILFTLFKGGGLLLSTHLWFLLAFILFSNEISSNLNKNLNS